MTIWDPGAFSRVSGYLKNSVQILSFPASYATDIAFFQSFRPFPTWWPWWWNVTFPPRPTGHHFPPFRRSTTPVTPTAAGSTIPSLPESCPRLPPSLAGRVELEDLTNRTWYELVRVQTHNSPAYGERISCSTLELSNSSSGDNVNDTEAEAFLEWRQLMPGTIYERETKNVTRLYTQLLQNYVPEIPPHCPFLRIPTHIIRLSSWSHYRTFLRVPFYVYFTIFQQFFLVLYDF